jgi:hypothetical protein
MKLAEFYDHTCLDGGLARRRGAQVPSLSNCSGRPGLLRVKRWTCLMLLCAASLTAPITLKAQDEETTRKLWDTAFINSGSKKPPPKRPTKRSYRVATPNVPTDGVNGETVVGVTLWRLRRATATDSGERLIEHEGADAGEPRAPVIYTWLIENNMPTVVSASPT